MPSSESCSSARLPARFTDGLRSVVSNRFTRTLLAYAGSPRSLAGVLAALTLAPAALAQAPAEKPRFIQPGGNDQGWAARRDPSRIGFAGVDARGFAGRGFGLRPFVADGTSGAGQSAPGIVARQRGTGLLLLRWVSARYADELWIGYDGVDFSARALLDGSVGLRLPFTRYGGPVARVALYAEATQLTGFSKTELRLGAGEFGYSYARGAGHLDLVFQIGPTWLGHVDLGSTHRNLAGLTWGTYLSSGWEDLILDFRIHQIAQDAAAGPVTDLRAEVCGLLGARAPRPSRTTRGAAARAFSGPNARDFRALLCADVSYGYAAAETAADPGDPNGPAAAASSSRWSTIGLSILIGRSSRLDPLPRVGL